MVTYGGMSRQPVVISSAQLIFKDIRLRGFYLGRWNTDPSNQIARLKMINDLTSLMSANKLVPPAHKFIPLAKYRDAINNTMKGYCGVKYIISFE